MGGLLMEILLSIVAWALQLGALLFLPALLFLLLRKRRKAAVATALLCAVVVFGSAVWIAFHPIRSCPAELEPYLSEDRWQEVRSVTPPIYSRNIPFFPVVITVERADAEELYWKVDWFPVGTTHTGLTPDGYEQVQNIFGR